MKIEILESIGIEGDVIGVGKVVEVPDQLGRELVWRKVARYAKAKTAEKDLETAPEKKAVVPSKKTWPK